jgi:hypothetical protein
MYLIVVLQYRKLARTEAFLSRNDAHTSHWEEESSFLTEHY